MSSVGACLSPPGLSQGLMCDHCPGQSCLCGLHTKGLCPPRAAKTQQQELCATACLHLPLLYFGFKLECIPFYPCTWEFITPVSPAPPSPCTQRGGRFLHSCSPSAQTVAADKCKGEVRHFPPVQLVCSLVGYFLFLTVAAVKGINLWSQT